MQREQQIWVEARAFGDRVQQVVEEVVESPRLRPEIQTRVRVYKSDHDGVGASLITSQMRQRRPRS